MLPFLLLQPRPLTKNATFLTPEQLQVSSLGFTRLTCPFCDPWGSLSDLGWREILSLSFGSISFSVLVPTLPVLWPLDIAFGQPNSFSSSTSITSEKLNGKKKIFILGSFYGLGFLARGSMIISKKTWVSYRRLAGKLIYLTIIRPYVFCNWCCESVHVGSLYSLAQTFYYKCRVFIRWNIISWKTEKWDEVVRSIA